MRQWNENNNNSSAVQNCTRLVSDNYSRKRQNEPTMTTPYSRTEYSLNGNIRYNCKNTPTVTIFAITLLHIAGSHNTSQYPTTSHNIPQYFTIIHNITQYLKISHNNSIPQNISQYAKTSRNIKQYLTISYIYINIPKHFKFSQYAKYLTMSQISHNIPEYLTISHNTQQYLTISHSIPQYLTI